jgi:YgiT-type zinc finger domain-containing protein
LQLCKGREPDEAQEVEEVTASLSRCARCGATDLEDREIEKLVRGGADVAALRAHATVCRHCGERYFPNEAIRALSRSAEFYPKARWPASAHSAASSRPPVDGDLRAEGEAGYAIGR